MYEVSEMPREYKTTVQRLPQLPHSEVLSQCYSKTKENMQEHNRIEMHGRKAVPPYNATRKRRKVIDTMERNK
jgi:hypothetical protein